MANKERGEFTLVAGEDRYVLRLTTNACAELEDLSGQTWDQIIAGINRGSVKSVRFLLWAALRDNHPDIATDEKPSVQVIGRLIDKAGGLAGVLEQIKAFVALNADSGEHEKAGPRSRPSGDQDGECGETS